MSLRTTDYKKNGIRWSYFFLTGLFIILLIRAFFSFNQNDESFYLALAHRLWLGEKLIIDEWQPAQFFAPVLLPFYSLYKAIVPSGEGVILFFRIIYIVLSFLTALYVMREFCKAGRVFSALIAASVVLLYSRANISGMSYYNICFLSGILIVCMYLKYQAPIIIGILTAIMVLSNPYMAILAVPILFLLLVKDKEHRKFVLMIFASVALIAVIYILLFLNNISEQIGSIRYLLSDPEHQVGFMSKARNAASGIYNITLKGVFAYLAVIFFFLFLLSDRKKKMLNRIFVILWYIVVFLSVLYSICKIRNSIVAAVTIPLTISAIPCFAIMIREKKYDIFGIVIYFWGLAIALMFFFASNTLTDAMTVGFAVSSIGSIKIYDSFDPTVSSDAAGNEKWAALGRKIYIITLACFFACLFLQRTVGVYRDSNLLNLNSRITSGPARGLYTTEEHAKQYNEILSVINKVYEDNPSGNVLHFRLMPWAYIASDWNYGTSSAWRTYNTVLKQYYQLNPEKYPNIVFVYSPDAGSWESSLFNNHTPNNCPNSNPDKYLCVLGTKEYTVIEKSESVTVYKLKE